jgi:nucleoside-diphosphate-sugar epimerase
MKVALTGATGFIGRAVLTELRAHGHDVRVLVRDPSRAKDMKAQVIEGDLNNRDALDALMSGTESVIHLAGAISAVDRSRYFEANEAGARNMAEAAARAGVGRFVHVSSLAAREPGLSDYAASKLAGEAAVEAASKDFNLLVLRPPAVYGPGDRATLPLFRALVGSPAVLPGSRTQRFSLIYVEDLARTAVNALATSDAGVAELDDGRPQGYSWEDLAHIASAHERHAIVPYFLPRPVLSVAAAFIEPLAKIRRKPAMLTRGKVSELYHPDWVARVTGRQPEDGVGFVEGFARTVSWYRGAGWLPPRRQRLINQAQDTRAQ